MADATPVDPLVGKRRVSESGDVFLLNAHGTVDGMLGGEVIDGVFTASVTEICSTYTAPQRLAGREFYSTPAIDGDSVVFNRRDGNQSQSYTIGG